MAHIDLAHIDIAHIDVAHINIEIVCFRCCQERLEIDL